MRYIAENAENFKILILTLGMVNIGYQTYRYLRDIKGSVK